MKINARTNMKRWTVVFRTLSNINRLKIIAMLSDGRKMNVGDIAENLKISFKGTSNHLAMLKNLDVLESQGTSGHVLYFISPGMPKDFRTVVDAM
ncbi:MAG: winged helix-turn-helix domain-containing protein [bacterium]|nr:winged helix-turn-helix domain-containing protein [bacterium]